MPEFLRFPYEIYKDFSKFQIAENGKRYMYVKSNYKGSFDSL